jgi:predicted lipase
MNSLVSHETVCELVILSMLIYEYGKNFSLKVDKNTKTVVNRLNGIITWTIRLDAIKHLLKSSPFGEVYSFYSVISTDLQVGITVSEINRRVTVIFRGSESKTDGRYSLNIFKHRLHDDVYVNRRFYKQLHDDDTYDKLKNDVISLICEFPDYDIFVTGHSLGGALSTLFGYELSRDIHELKKKITVVSFASPRVGNLAFRKSHDLQMNLAHLRVTNARDIITALPMINFKHVGTSLSLSDTSLKFYENYSYNWCKYSLFTCNKVSEHNIELYLYRLIKHKW